MLRPRFFKNSTSSYDKTILCSRHRDVSAIEYVSMSVVSTLSCPVIRIAQGKCCNTAFHYDVWSFWCVRRAVGRYRAFIWSRRIV